VASLLLGWDTDQANGRVAMETTLPTNQNPDQERDRNRHTQNPPPTDPNQPNRERPMDDPGRGQGDKFEKKLPGNEMDQDSRFRSSRDA
jgi:hypothetical protein